MQTLRMKRTTLDAPRRQTNLAFHREVSNFSPLPRVVPAPSAHGDAAISRHTDFRRPPHPRASHALPRPRPPPRHSPRLRRLRRIRPDSEPRPRAPPRRCPAPRRVLLPLRRALLLHDGARRLPRLAICRRPRRCHLPRALARWADYRLPAADRVRRRPHLADGPRRPEPPPLPRGDARRLARLLVARWDPPRLPELDARR